MTKYIHYRDSQIDSSALISDEVDEISKGYHLYIEFECEDFDVVLDSVKKHLPKFKPFVMDEDGVCNYSTNTLKGHLISLLSNDKSINMIPYKMKIHQDGKVMVYSREIE